ncbi:uncharacterized protein LOC142986792 isoform X2 [Anticarsia gemmatalis]|uniref:uncharacterized protein LOC142986792 isoform X2 n=1 Tax=Anticarsia gemmatalis TaxID=129554 RepID=UPI003F76DD98
MSIVFPKKKEKRQRTSSNETNTSFVKHVTSRVSGLLPATITKWFSSPSSSNANGSAPLADATDSSTEDEAPESPIITQPPAKRMRINAPNRYHHFGPTDAHCSSSNIEITELPVSNYPGQYHNPTIRNNIILTPIRTPNETYAHEIKDHERDLPRYKLNTHAVGSTGQSVANKRKSIFDRSPDDAAKTRRTLTTSAEKKPYFKPTLLGSPFYPGRTMYGGAAAASYMNQANIQQHTVALVNETKSSEDSVMSSSTRRIMDLLESYSSPLTEARRIPQYTRPKMDSFNTSHDPASPYGNRTLSYKTQELYVPGIAAIMRLKQRSRIMNSTKTARQIIASHSSATEYPMTYPSSNSTTSNQTSQFKPPSLPSPHIPPSPPRPPSPPSLPNLPNLPSLPSQPIPNLPQQSVLETVKEQSNMVTKVKTRRVARTNRGNQDQFETITPVKLPSATLQIDQNKLPTFAFDTPTVSKLPATSTPKVAFPVNKPVETKENAEVPASNIKENDIASGKSSSKPKDWQCPDCWVSNKADVNKCVCCGYKQATATVAKCSKCKLADSQPSKDKCVICENMASPQSGKSVQASSKWKCDGCWIMNEDNVTKCVCCGGNRPTEASKAAKAKQYAAIPEVTRPSCGGCFTISSIPPLAITTPTFFGSSANNDSGFISIAKIQKSDKWECSSCLVRNESDKLTCVCCGSEKEPKTKLPENKFNFGLSSNSTFKFGIDPKVQEANIASKPDDKTTPESKLKEQSETNNNVLAETPTFTFALPTKKIDTKIDVPKVKPGDTIRFTFGVPKAESSPEKKSETVKIAEKDKEKPQEVPQISFASATESSKTLAGFFASSSKVVQGDKDKPTVAASTSNVFSPPTVVETKDPPSNPITLESGMTSNDKPQTPSTFTLGTSTMKAATNLFVTPASITNSTNPFSPPSQATPATTATSATTMPLFKPPEIASGSLFQKPDSSASATTSLFQKSETTNSTAPAPTAPLFSFGNNNTSNSSSLTAPTAGTSAASSDAPKFPFTFGSNNTTKTEAPPPPYKSPFGSIDSNAKNTNSFSITSGNTLVSNNALATSTLGGPNGLAASNGLPGTSMAGNNLGGGNPLSGNTLGSGTLGNNTLGGSLGGNTLGTNALGANTLGGNTLPTNAMGGNTMSGNSLSNNLLGSNTILGNGMSATMSMGGNALVSNSLTGGNGVTSTSTLGGNNGLPGNPSNSLQHNPLNNNVLSSGTPNLFGNVVQKENMWNSNNNASSTNVFVSNTTSNSMPKAPAFSFGAPTPFNANSSAPTFGNTTQSAPNIFGMANQNNNNQPSLFSNPVQTQSPAHMFGSPQPTSNPGPQMGMFGSPTMSSTPSFGAPSMPSFDPPSMSPAPSRGFNFGASNQNQPTGIFGFGQQQAQQQPPQAGVYSFGAPSPAGPAVQFAMGTAPNTATNAAPRRVRKAVRRNRL